MESNRMKSEANMGMNPVTINRAQAKARYNIGENLVDRVAKEAQAVVKIGRRKVYLVAKMDAYFEEEAMAQ